MNKGDLKRFTMVMAAMAENFQKDLTESMIDVYWRVLEDLTIEDFEKASLNLINIRKITGTFPLVAEIREAAGGGSSSQTLQVVMAWDKLRYAIQYHAPYDSVQFDDPIIFYIVRAWGGWEKMGDWPEEENKWKLKEFEKLYLAYAASNTLPEPDGYLVGLTEFENRAKFPDFVPRPILITGETGRFKSLPWVPLAEQKKLSG